MTVYDVMQNPGRHIISGHILTSWILFSWMFLIQQLQQLALGH